MGVILQRGRRIRVAERLADEEERGGRRQQQAREGVPEVVQQEGRQSGAAQHALKNEERILPRDHGQTMNGEVVGCPISSRPCHRLAGEALCFYL